MKWEQQGFAFLVAAIALTVMGCYSTAPSTSTLAGHRADGKYYRVTDAPEDYLPVGTVITVDVSTGQLNVGTLRVDLIESTLANGNYWRGKALVAINVGISGFKPISTGGEVSFSFKGKESEVIDWEGEIHRWWSVPTPDPLYVGAKWDDDGDKYVVVGREDVRTKLGFFKGAYKVHVATEGGDVATEWHDESIGFLRRDELFQGAVPVSLELSSLVVPTETK